MSKKVEVNIPPFVGSVTFYKPFTLEHVLAIEDAQDAAAAEETESAFLKKIVEIRNEEGGNVRAIWASRTDRHFVAAICKCVEKWELEGLPEALTPETFPMTPRGKSIELIRFLVEKIMEIYNGETNIPNAS